MTTPVKSLELPLHLVGVSDQVTDWLRQAGIPVVRVSQESLMQSAFDQKPARGSQTMASPARCLLFDSRDAWSRVVVKSQQHDSSFKIDIAAWLIGKTQNPLKTLRKQQTPTQPARLEFLDRLKKTLESQGGLWARAADFPFPYQGVVCLDGVLPKAGSPLEMTVPETHRLDAIQRRYDAGLPSMITASDLSGLADLPPVTGLQSRGLPLLWRTDWPEFTQWWGERNHLELKLRQTSTHYYVDCWKLNSSFCPVLEIWRGNHLACIPLRSESIIVRKDGLVFQQQPARHPSGFTAGWPDTALDAASSCLSA